MSLYSRFGGQVTVVRKATVNDVKVFENRRPDKEDKSRTGGGMRAICRYVDTGKEFLADVAYLRADGGITEILDAFKSCQG